MSDPSYIPGAWFAVVTPRAVVLLEDSVSPEHLQSVWETCNAAEPSLDQLIEVVTGGRFVGAPLFGLGLVDGTGLRVVVRTGVTAVAGESVGNARSIVSGNANTWVEEILHETQSLRLFRAAAPSSGHALPLTGGVVGADSVIWTPSVALSDPLSDPLSGPLSDPLTGPRLEPSAPISLAAAELSDTWWSRREELVPVSTQPMGATRPAVEPEPVSASSRPFESDLFEPGLFEPRLVRSASESDPSREPELFESRAQEAAPESGPFEPEPEPRSFEPRLVDSEPVESGLFERGQLRAAPAEPFAPAAAAAEPRRFERGLLQTVPPESEPERFEPRAEPGRFEPQAEPGRFEPRVEPGRFEPRAEPERFEPRLVPAAPAELQPFDALLAPMEAGAAPSGLWKHAPNEPARDEPEPELSDEDDWNDSAQPASDVTGYWDPRAMGEPADLAQGDHDGMTLLGVPGLGQLAPEAEDEDVEPGRENTMPGLAVGPMVMAVRCINGHPNPPENEVCRNCSAPVPEQSSTTIMRPSLGFLHFSSGQVVPLDRPVLIGRSPSADRVQRDDIPRPVKIDNLDQDVSRNHVEVRLDGWNTLAVDLNSANGTVVTVPGRAPQRLAPREPFLLTPGVIVALSEEVSFSFQISG